MRKFLEEIGEDRRQYIRSISFHFVGNGENEDRTAELLYLCTNLRKVEITILKDFSDSMNIFRARGVHKLMGLRGCEEVVVNSSVGRFGY